MPRHNVPLATIKYTQMSSRLRSLSHPARRYVLQALAVSSIQCGLPARGCRGASSVREWLARAHGQRASTNKPKVKPAPAASCSTRSASAKFVSDAMLVGLCNQWMLKLNIQACVENLEWCHEAARAKELFQARSSQWRWLSPRFETEREILKDAVSCENTRQWRRRNSCE